MLPGMELMACPNLAVPRQVMHHVVHVESSYNPYAIGVVGGRLVRQPRNLPEALSTVRMLEQRGYNFSLGVAQVNRYNLAKYGLQTYQQAFEPCANLQAGSRILAECYRRSGSNWGKSFSCYYSGDFVTGYRHGYVQKIYASMRRGLDAQADAVAPIQVIDRATRRANASVRSSALARAPDRLDGGAQSATLARRRGMASAPALDAAREGNVGAAQTSYAIATQVSAQAPATPLSQQGQAHWSATAQAPQTLAPLGPVRLTAARLGQSASAPAVAPSSEKNVDNAFVF